MAAYKERRTGDDRTDQESWPCWRATTYHPLRLPQVETIRRCSREALVETTRAERTDPLLTNVAGLHCRIRFPTNMGVERENRWSGATLEEPILLSNDNDDDKPLEVDTSHYVMSKTGLGW